MTDANKLYFAFATLLALYVVHRFSQQPKQPLPPGPKPWPLIGNIADLPPKGQVEWKHWIRHKDLYGPISSVTALGQTIILIHDREAASELLEKRALTNSARPVSTFANDLCGFDQFLVMQSPGRTFHSYRKLAHSQLGTQKALARFKGVLDVGVRRGLLRMLDDPASLDHALHDMTSSILLKVCFGYNTSQNRNEDLLADINDQLMANFSEAIVPGAWLVDLVPALKYLPDWFPGAGFKATARRANQINRAATEAPFRFVQRARRQEPSLVSDCLRARDEGSNISEYDIKWVASSLHGAGVETTTGSMRTFFLAMSLYPEVQRRAQQEMDELMSSTSRSMPGLDDRGKLPYLNALVKEILRWLPVAPMGVPHMAEKDDTYGGFRIPKGAILIPAVWSFAHDPARYHDPESFKPERYLAPCREPDPETFVFGFGRRVCPGKRLADESIFLTVAKTLAVFDVLKALDAQGREIEPVVGIPPGAVVTPLPFSVRIVPRSQMHAHLVRSVGTEHPWEEGDSRLVEADIRRFFKDM